ncbi:glycosyltransferase family 4 protein [Pseudoxanthomonas beigongshangi]
MRIAQISPLLEAVPPRLYGGTERVVSYLTEALVAAGHEVTLFASGDSRTSATLVPGRDSAIRLDESPLKSAVAAHLAMLSDVARRAQEFDILHFHIDLLPFPLFEPHAARTLSTLHGRQDKKDLPAYYRRWPEFPLVSISESQRRPIPWANWLGTVYHGLPEDLYAPAPAPSGDYLAFLGRVSRDKRLDRAIAIARRVGLPLRIAAKVDTPDRAYFRETIHPLLEQDGVEFIGEINDSEKPAFLGNARALLFPIDWPEPFGLVMIEAMACGTPVIGWRCGSVPEVVDEGVTGHIVDSIADAAAAVERVDRLPRARIRETFERRFSATAMAQDYIALYRTLLARPDLRMAKA